MIFLNSLKIINVNSVTKMILIYLSTSDIKIKVAQGVNSKLTTFIQSLHQYITHISSFINPTIKLFLKVADY
jgi:hypothetical protein